MKNILIGVGMLILAFYMLWEQGKQSQEFLEQNRLADDKVIGSPLEANRTYNSSQQDIPNNSSGLDFNQSESISIHSSFDSLEKEELYEGLSNNFSSLLFTNHSGGVREVNLKQFSRLSRDYNMTHPGEPLLSLSFVDES